MGEAAPQAEQASNFKLLAATAADRPWNDGKGAVTCLRLAFSLQRLQSASPGAFASAGPVRSEWPQTPSGMKPAALAELLEVTGFLADLPDLRFALPADAESNGNRSETIPAWLLRYADQIPPGFAPLLEEQYGRTFGGRLAAALLRDYQLARRDNGGKEIAPSLLLKVLGAELPALQQLPAERQREFALLPVNTREPFHQRPQGAALAAWDWHTDQVHAHWRLRMAEMLAAPRAGFWFDPGNTSQSDLPEIVEHLLPEDPAAVGKLLDHLEARPLPRWLSFLQPEPQFPRLMQQMTWAWRKPAPDRLLAARLRALLRLTHAPAARSPEPRGTAEGLAILLRRWWNVAGETPPADWPDRILAAIQAAPADLLTEVEARALLPTATMLLRRLMGRDRRTVLRTAQRFSNASGNAPLRTVLARACRLAALQEERFAVCEHAWQRSEYRMEKHEGYLGGRVEHFPQTLTLSAGPLLPAQQPLLEFLQDESLAPALRCWFAGHLASTLPDVWDAPLLDAALPLLEEAGDNLRDPNTRPAEDFARAALRFSAPRDAAAKSREQRIVQAVRRIPGPHRPDLIWLCLAARSCDDAALIEAVQAECAATKEALTGLFRVLVNSRRFAAARLLLEKYPERVLEHLHPWQVRIPGEFYQAATPQCLRDFQANLPEGRLRLLAEAVILAARDAPDILAAKLPGHYPRCEAFAPTLYAAPLPESWEVKLQVVFRPRQP